ncbi:MAG: hypothetical protein C4539_08750 [Ignavibacteriales bacterium]|nr:MAG: hypothetical protein C4539_08750 [Ignavibacteriales bacterium]
MYRKHSKQISLFILFLFTGFIVSVQTGCKKEAEKPVDKTEVQKDTTTPAKVDTPKVVEQPKVEYPDLLGKWSGTLYKRQASLKITKQDTTSFSGSLTIFFRENISQQVSGKLNMSNNKITMSDLVHNKMMGRYSGKLSEDGKTMSGTFTMNADKSQHNFNFVKQ